MEWSEKRFSQFSEMAFKACCLSLVQLVAVLSVVECANILLLLPVPSASHRLWNNVIVEGLARRGHNLTVLSVENERPRPNVTFIYMENIYESLSEHYAKAPWSLGTEFAFTAIKEHHQLNSFISRRLFESRGLRQLANYPRAFKFDAVVLDFTLGQSLLAFVEHFHFPPLICVSPQALPASLAAVSAAQIFPSYISHFSITSTPAKLRGEMRERFTNMIYHTFDWFYRKYVYMKNENRRVGKVFVGNKLKLELLEESDLVLINRAPGFDDVLALPPNVVAVGGLQAERSGEIQNDVSELLPGALKT
jgi:glucuronosyltransferase